MMRKIHLISISDPLIYELAVAIRDRGYEVSVSGEHVPEEMQAVLDEKGIEFYNNVIDECLKYNIEPVVTMYHFDLPYCLEEKGGWLNRDTIDAFVEYAEII